MGRIDTWRVKTEKHSWILSWVYRSYYRFRIRRLVKMAYKTQNIDDAWRDLFNFAAVDKPSEQTCHVIEGFLGEQIELMKESKKPPEKNDIILICVEKNSIAYLEQFLSYYRNIGIRQFLMIDNSSTDGTLEYLLEEGDVTLFMANTPFESQIKVGWILQAVRETGLDRCYLRVDIDEFLSWENMEGSSVNELVLKAREQGMSTIRSVMADMYPSWALMDPSHEDPDFLNEYVYFDDSSSYYHDKWKDRIFGGMRGRLIGAKLRMDKYILFQPERGQIPVNNHDVTGVHKEEEKICRCVLRHYKFLPSQKEKLSFDANTDASGYSNFGELKKYNILLRENVLAAGVASVRYESSKSLGKLDFIVPL